MSGAVITEDIKVGIKRFTRDQYRRAAGAMTKGAVRIRQAAQGNLKWKNRKAGPGGRATGNLQRGITDKTVMKPGMITGTIRPKAKYAPFIEGKPTPRRHFVPFSTAPGLRQWAKSHNVPVAWWGPGSKGMMVGGKQSVTPFMEPAYKENVGKVRRDIEKALRPR